MDQFLLHNSILIIINIGKPCWPIKKNSCNSNGVCRSLGAGFEETHIFPGFKTNLDFSNQKSGCRLKGSSGALSSSKSQEGTQIDLFRILHSLTGLLLDPLLSISQWVKIVSKRKFLIPYLLQGILPLWEFLYCKFYYRDFSKHSKNGKKNINEMISQKELQAFLDFCGFHFRSF